MGIVMVLLVLTFVYVGLPLLGVWIVVRIVRRAWYG